VKFGLFGWFQGLSQRLKRLYLAFLRFCR